jgi:uncharacterized damage-inducible protein DinB
MTKTILALCAIALPVLCQSQQPDLKSISGHAKSLEKMAQSNILKSAEKMPEENYSFKPTPDIRSYAELIGHVADASYMFCSASLGEKSPATASAEKTMKTKAALVEALTAAFAYCDKAYAALTDENAGQTVKFFGGERAREGVLSFNTAHLMEHYGNIVTYLRLKNIVPPSSEPRK